MTPLRTTSRDRFILALLFVVAISLIGFACLRPTPPPDPIVNGHPISWWFSKENLAGQNTLDPEYCRAAGSRAVQWLAYTAEHGAVGRKPTTPSWLRQQWEILVQRFQLWLDPAWKPGADPFDGARAFEVLRTLGEDAAPAIPALVRIIERSDSEDAARDDRPRQATYTLPRIGSDALPECLRLIATRPPAIRRFLILDLATDLNPALLSEAECLRVLDVLLAACHDPDDETRYAALHAIARICSSHGFRPEMKPAIAPTIDFLTNSKTMRESSTYWALGTYGENASAAVPPLIELLDSSDDKTVEMAATALWRIAPTDRRVILRMRELLSSRNSRTRDPVRSFLRRLERLPADLADHP